ncbi:MAG: helix-turn-helix domain-containing protein [Chloroflexi bacterium]|nr:helix-turn-helix domain-containing protein [Chloroflexota bacterium]
MTDQRFGAVIRFLRIRRRWRQQDLADRARVSQSVVSRMERGHFGSVSLDKIRAVAAALDIRVDINARWRAGDLDRMLAAGHSALHEAVARRLLHLDGWEFAPEVSFSKFGERGVIDILAWHVASTSLLVIELKTELVDFNEMLGTLDRKRRLAAEIARERGWLERAASVSVWLIVADSSTSRRRAADHATMLRAALPLDGRAIRSWLARPGSATGCLSFWSTGHAGTGTPPSALIRSTRHRIRVPPTREQARTPARPSASEAPEAP